MTSIKTLWHKGRERLRPRQWPLVLSLVLYFLYYVVGVFLALSGLVSANRAEGISAEVLRFRQLSVLGDHFGCGNFAAVFAPIFGVILAMQGFAYLHEGQPAGRRNFWNVTRENILLFLFSTLSMRFLGLLVALCMMQDMSLGLLLTTLYQAFREFVFFLGICGLTTLAMMLCGNLLMGLLVTGFLMTAEFLTRILIHKLRLYFCWTAYSLTDGWELRVLSSPFYYYNMGLNAFGNLRADYYVYNYGVEMTLPRVREYVQLSIGWDLCGLLLALGFLLLAYWVYRRRPKDAAGQAGTG